MIQQTVNSDILGDIFRLLSLKQRSGVLLVKSSRFSLQIEFVDGRIVSVSDDNQPTWKQVCYRLVNSGRLSQKAATVLTQREMSIDQFSNLAIEKLKVAPKELYSARETVELNLLYSLRDIADGTLSFSPRIVRNQQMSSLYLYPGQVLLDMVEIGKEEKRLRVLLGEYSSENSQLVLAENSSQLLNSDETVVFDSLKRGTLLTEIFNCCLINQHRALLAIMSLHEKELITKAEEDEFGLIDDELSDFDDEEILAAEGLLEPLDWLSNSSSEDTQTPAPPSETKRTTMRQRTVRLAEDGSGSGSSSKNKPLINHSGFRNRGAEDNLGSKLRILALSLNNFFLVNEQQADGLKKLLILLGFCAFGSKLICDWLIALRDFQTFYGY